MSAAPQAAPFRELSSSVLRGFVGGLNIRDATNELAPSESPDLWNVVLDERGGVGSRLGYAKWNTTAYPGGTVLNIFEWRKGGHVVVQVGASLYLDTSTASFKTFTAAARCDFAEFGGKLYVIHPVDGLFVSDGTSGGTAAVVGSPKGTTLAVWQNRLWLAGDGTARLYFSAIAAGGQWTPQQTVTAGGSLTLPAATVTVASTAGFDPAGAIKIGTGTGQQIVQYTGVTATTFTGCSGGAGTFPNGTTVTQGANFNDVIEKDEQPIVCLCGASGQDVIGQPGLIVFKKRSAYRVTDSDTGSYVTIDPTIGTASAISAVVAFGRVYSLSAQGIFSTDGRRPLRNESDKLRPLWSPDQLNYPASDLWCAGHRGERLVFSVPTVGKSYNDLALEHYPADGGGGATVLGSNAASCYGLLTAGAETLLSGSPTASGQVYVNGRGGTDDGAPIHSWYQSAWLAPHAERMARLRSVLLEGRGSFTLYTRLDYSRSQGEGRGVTIARSGFRWNQFRWNDGSRWGTDSYAAFSDPLPSLGVCRTVAFKLEATTTTTKTAPGLSSSDVAPTVGAWGVYAIHLKTVPLRQL